MKKRLYCIVMWIMIWQLWGCSPVNRPPAEPTPLEPETPAVDGAISSSPTSPPFPLSLPGPFLVGSHTFRVTDESRNGREIYVEVYYPAGEAVDADPDVIMLDADPDRSGAPYPLILTGTNSGRYLFRSHLASYGFVMAIVRSPGFSYTAAWNNYVIDVPLDFLFVLDQLTANPPELLAGILDTDRVGVAGYSSDGLFSLALGGARINPDYYLSQCAQADSLNPPLNPSLTEYLCSLSERWDEFETQIDLDRTTGSDGLWQPTTDDRILAIMPMAPDSAWLYGAEGLAEIDLPTLIIAGTADELSLYDRVACYLYQNLMNADRVLISFIDKGHMMVEDPASIDRIRHFATAFFGYYLQEREDYRYYFSLPFVDQFDDLAWGVYPPD